MASTIKIPTEFTAVDKFSSVVSKMTAGVSNFSKSTASAVQRVNTKVNGMFDSMDKVSQLALGAGFAGMFALAVQNNIEYNDSLASISAITGAVGKDLADLEKQAMKTAKSQNMLGADVFKAYELIASAKPELLKNTKLLDQVANSTTRLSKSAKMDMGSAADSLTTSLNQFRLGGEQSNKVVDNLAAGTVYGASSIKQTTDALTKFGTVAAATGTKVDESIALIQLASPFEKGAEAGTKLRNVLSKMAGAKILPKDAIAVLGKYGVNLDVITNKSLPLSTRLKEMGKIGGDTTAVMQVFGLENQALAQAILQDTAAFDKMLIGVNEVGWAQKMAAKNTFTFKGGIDAIKNSFFNATTVTNSNNKSLNLIIDTMFYLSNNMETVISIIGALIGLFVTFKTIVLATTLITGAYNIAIGIMGALTGTASIAIGQSTIAMNAYKIATGFVTAAQWAWNVAMTANPIGLIIVGVVALIALIAVIISKWDEWGASVALFLGPIGMVISAIRSFSQHWDMVESAFSTGGVLGALKAIGIVLLDSLLMPMQQFLELVSKIPGMGDIAGAGAEKIADMRQSLGLLEAPESKQVKATAKATVNGKVDVNVSAKGGATAETSSKSKGGIPVRTTSTQGAF